LIEKLSADEVTEADRLSGLWLESHQNMLASQ